MIPAAGIAHAIQFRNRVARARRALRGETGWEPDLVQPDVLAEAATQELSDLRTIIDQLRILLPGRIEPRRKIDA